MKTTILAAVTAVMFGFGGLADNTAEAGGFHGHYGWNNHYHGHIHHGVNPYRYRGHGHFHWHDTSHFDYVPGGFYRHGNHFHYRPGGWIYHRDGHWDLHH